MPMSNTSMLTAKKVKDNEFYTRRCDVEDELKHHHDRLRGKVVFCNCDEVCKSEFPSYLSKNYDAIGLAGLLSVGYGMKQVMRWNGRMWVKDRDVQSGSWNALSKQGAEMLEEVDVVISNPPFSLIQQYLSLLIDNHCDFLVLCPVSVISTPFGLHEFMDGHFQFGVTRKQQMFFDRPDGTLKKVPLVMWATTFDHGIYPEPLELKVPYDEDEHLKYDKIDAINTTSYTKIPRDYYGVIGVPPNYITRHCPDQFKIVGTVKPSINGKLVYQRILIQRTESYGEPKKNYVQMTLFDYGA